MSSREYHRNYTRAWRQRNPDYHREMTRVYRARRKPHLCPGNGRPCMVWIPGDRLYCHFCTRTADLERMGP